MPKKKVETGSPVEADHIAPDMIPNTQTEGTDPTKPISAANPPPSKRRLREQGSPVSDGDVLQIDERGLDEEQKDAEEAVRIKTGSDAKKTRVTDAGRG